MNFLVLFMAWPFLEILLFIQMGAWIGFAYTILLCGLSALCGFVVLQTQGLRTMERMRESYSSHEMPVQEIFDRISLFMAGILLILPGFISDFVAILLLLPPFRVWLREKLTKNIVVASSTGGSRRNPRSNPSDNIIEGEFTRMDEHDKPLTLPEHKTQE